VRVLKKELWPYRVSLDVVDHDDRYYIETWLGETLGCFKDRWNAVYKYNGTDFYFRDGTDSTMFSLRWS
jgi:hypothetical protein